MAEITHIRDLTPDQMNANRRTERGEDMIETSLNEVGAARSIVIDENGRILAGNGVVDAAARAGITNVQVVDADGNTIIAVRRKGLTENEKTRLALYDNRTSELSKWDAAVLACLEDETPEITKGLFTDDELLYLINGALEEEVPNFEPVGEDEQPRLDQKSPITCPHCGEEFVPK